MAETIKSRIRVKRCTNDTLISNKDNILSAGAPLYNTETGELYIGNGDGETTLGQSNPINISEFDTYIRTQEQFSKMLGDDTWYGAKNILLNGVFKTILSDGTNVGWKIPSNVLSITGVNNTSVDISGHIAEDSIWFGIYASNSNKETILKNLNITINNLNGYGVYNFKEIRNCTLTMDYKGRTTTLEKVVGFYKCDYIIDSGLIISNIDADAGINNVIGFERSISLINCSCGTLPNILIDTGHRSYTNFYENIISCKFGDDYITEASKAPITYTTEAPTASPTDGTLIIYVGTAVPDKRFDRVLYIITG